MLSFMDVVFLSFTKWKMEYCFCSGEWINTTSIYVVVFAGTCSKRYHVLITSSQLWSTHVLMRVSYHVVPISIQLPSEMSCENVARAYCSPADQPEAMRHLIEYMDVWLEKTI